MPIVRINKANVHIQELNTGAKESVLMVHSMLGSLAEYYFSIAPVLARKYHIVLYDLKGHGKSEKVTSGYGLQAMADDLLALMDTLKMPSVHLAGYSYGALIALKMAARHPQKIKKLVIIEAPDPDKQEILELTNTYSKQRLTDYLSKSTHHTFPLGKRHLDQMHGMCEFLLKETSFKTETLEDRDFFTGSEIDSILHDTLLVYGDHSDCAPAGNKLNKKMRACRLQFIPGNHYLPLQAPALVASQLSTFFEN